MVYINCLPSYNWLLKSEDKQFAQLFQVSSPLSFSFFPFLANFRVSCVWRLRGSEGYVKCILLFRFPMVWWSFFSLSWLSRQSVYHMESVGRKTVSSVFLIAPFPPPPLQHTHTLLSLSFLPRFTLSQLNRQNPMTGNWAHSQILKQFDHVSHRLLGQM